MPELLNHRGTRTLAILVALAVAAVVAYRSSIDNPQEQQVQLLDPARVIVVRTPGGMLEAATLVKVEEFGWSSRFECPLIDCPRIFRPTVSRLKVPVHYTYRLPLAATWELHLKGDHYDLEVPGLQPKSPVAFDTTKLEIETKKGWVTPSASATERALLRQFGPELEKRAGQDTYLQLAQPEAEKTVREFVSKWMAEQKVVPGKPIQVRFRYSP